MDDYRADVSQLATGLRKGIEKVLSTLGIHELRGYGRLFSCIGLKPELASVFDTPAYAASEHGGGVGFAELDADADRRRRVLAGADEGRPGKTFRFYPKVYKAAVAAAAGAGDYEAYSRRVRRARARAADRAAAPARPALGPRADPARGRERGGRRALLPARDLVDELRLPGRGGLPRLRRGGAARERDRDSTARAARSRTSTAATGSWRGQQVASGRFGVTSELVNSSSLVEIKIGQGAKPGEGGHLPARKVTAKVAAARNASPGTDLISPSNNHDLYSIEDLAQLIDELKTANPEARVSVKVPVVPNIGTIAVGIAKAGRGRGHALGLRRRHRRGALARAAARGAAGGHRHADRAPRAAGGRAARAGRDLGRRRLSPRPRRGQAALPGRQPDRLRHAGDGLARLHDLPRLPARHLPRRHRDADRVRRGGAAEGAEEVHPAALRARRGQLRALLRGARRGGARAECRARLRERPGACGAQRAAGAGARARGGRPRGPGQAVRAAARPGGVRLAAHAGAGGPPSTRRDPAEDARGRARASPRRSCHGPGARCLRRRGHRATRRRRRPGRCREGDLRRHGGGHEEAQPFRRAGARLGRQVVRLRRAARAPVRAGRCRLALLACASRARTW